MSIQFDLPAEMERRLRGVVHDLDRTAKEAALADLYRHGRLSQAELGEALSLSRYEVDGFLKRHAISEDLATIEEHAEDMEHLRRLAG